MDKKKPSKRRVLGRGLGALLEDSPQITEDRILHDTNVISEVSITSIEANPFQPRTQFDQEALKELAISIKVQGIIQPITVRRKDHNKYQLISGGRRLKASELAGLRKIPAFVRTANDQQMLEMALIENIQRENLNALEIALSYQRLISECKLKQEELGDRVGKNRTTVTNYLRLLKLPPDIQIALRDNKISMGHARAILGIENAELQLAILRKILSAHLSVRNVEDLVRKVSEKTPSKHSPKTEENPELRKLQKSLSSHFGTKVVVRSDSKNKGEIRIPFLTADDLDRILEIINPS